MSEQSVFDIEQQNKKITEEQRRKRAHELSDLKSVLKTPQGRRFIWRLWEKCGIYRNPFTPNANQTGYNSGRMSIGQEVLRDVMQANVSVFAQIQQEHITAQNSKKEAHDGS